MEPNLRQLQAFVHACHLGSLTRAAERMHVTQAAVSVLIRQLEEALGVRLFDRTSRSLQPTLAAREVLDTAERMLRDLNEMKSAARGLAERTSGRLHFAVTPAVAATLLPGVIEAFKARYPGIQLVMDDLPPDRLVAPVVQEQVEFSIGTPDAQADDVDLATLLRDHLCVICRRDSPLAEREAVGWREIREMDIITVRQGTRIRGLVDEAMAQTGGPFEPAWEVSFLSTALAMAARGIAVAVLPSYLIASFQYANLVAVRLADPVISRNLYLVTRRGRSLSPAAEGFVALLKEAILAGPGGA